MPIKNTVSDSSHGGASAQIWFGLMRHQLGWILVATTPTGVCSVALGDDESALETELRAEFSNAQITRDDARLGAQLQIVNRIANGETAPPDFSLDARATAFQARVWRELRAIPSGQTRTYAQIAEKLEMPTAARAIARACATNPIALVVPCHRIVRGDGSLAGYRWGIERKKRLLELEKIANRDNFKACGNG